MDRDGVDAAKCLALGATAGVIAAKRTLATSQEVLRELTDERGDRVAMRDLRGSPVIVTFLYTNCEDTCPPAASWEAAT